MTKNCFILYGPTASGKSRIAYELAETLPIEIINMDSVQVFKDFNIGAAKPDQAILNTIPHHLIDIVSVPDHFSVATYLDKLNECLTTIHSKGKIPMLVGGTMLYLNAIVKGGLSDIPSIDESLRLSIMETLDILTQKQKYDLLITVDPTWAKQIHPHDRQRTVRGLLVYFATSKPLSSYTTLNSSFLFNPKLMALDGFDRSWLHNQIDLRAEAMVEAGLIEEVIELIRKHPKDLDHFAFRSIGYKQVIDMINKDYSLALLKEHIKAATRQFAKRQITWMKHHQPDLVIKPNDYSIIKIKEWTISHSNCG